MSSYYYLISSLAMPTLGAAVPQTLESFMESCSQWLSESEYKELENISLIPDYNNTLKNKVIKKWINWETCLRNSIAKNRAANIDKNASPYIQEEKDVFSEIEKGIQDAYSAGNPLLKEKLLDELRWKQLDNMESGHNFDLSKLFIYKLRLMLAEKWISREKEKGEKKLDEVLLKFYTPEEENSQ